MKQEITCLLFFVLIVIACRKTKDVNPELEKLPLPTQTGENTCGCLVNGKAWIAHFVDSFVYTYTIGTRVFMNLYASDSTAINLVLRGYTPAVNTNFKINNGQGWSNYGAGGCNYNSNAHASNLSNLSFTRFDTVNYIMSGTFEFTYKSLQSACPDLMITDCRFDLKYSKL